MIPSEHIMTKGQLLFIGLGLNDENDITLKGLEQLKHCDTVYAEFYTSQLTDTTIKVLEKKIKKKILLVSRTDIEKATYILDEAEKKTVALLVGGDPMMATTHIDLRLRAKERNIPTSIIHNSSITTVAPGLLGLQNYKFGRTTTLVFPEKNYFPTSPYTVIKNNIPMGLHTLVLLDIQAEKNRYMTAHEGLNLLIRMEQEKKDNIIDEKHIVCVVARAGSPTMILAADTIPELLTKEFGPPLHSLVIPGELHFMEIQALVAFAGLPEEKAKKIQKL